jgi:hypothetical protein
MIMFRVRYDRLNRRLKILDEEVEALLEDGDVYMLAVFDAGNITEITPNPRTAAASSVES